MPHVETEHVVSFLAFITEACSSEAVRAAGWHVVSNVGNAKSWIYVRYPGASTPQQGWKLHVSANVWSAEAVLRTTLPVLLADNASFKVASSRDALHALNSGNAGLSQVGKFITVYPQTDAQAVRLAASLHAATQGLVGPVISSDRPLVIDSLVHYRYASFGSRRMQTLLGPIVSMLVAPNGDLVPDRRLTCYTPPEWVVDPFIAAGIASPLPAPQMNVGTGYLAVTKLHESALNVVFLGIDVKHGRSCVLKQARRRTVLGPQGQNANDQLRREAEILRRLAPDPRFPAVFELVEHNDDLFLVMEDIEGETLETYTQGLAAHGRLLPNEQVVGWGRALCSILERLHACGFVYDDLKPPNVIVAADGQLHLIDFGSAHERGALGEHRRSGTRGYISPQQARGEPAAITDDVYGLGAILYYLATSADPSQAPDPFDLLNRPLSRLNPRIDSRLTQVITRCLDHAPARRFASMAAVDVALARIGDDVPVTHPPVGGETVVETDARCRYRTLARRLGSTLRTTAVPAPEGHGLVWVSHHPITTSGTIPRDLNAGSAGAVLALAELVAAFNSPQLRTVLADGARWLMTAPRLAGQPLPGLYVGEAGIGAALLRAGQVLGDDVLITAAAERSRWIATLPYASPDLFHGTAGRLRFHLFLWDATGDAEHLRAAVDAGTSLLTVAEDTADGGLQWTIPPGYDDLSGKAYVGYAHGTAGIADALLDLFEASGEERFFVTAQRAGRTVAHLAIAVLEDESGRDWPTVVGAEPAGGFWCHGAAGVGRLFLHAAQLGVMEEAADLAAQAARTAARGRRWAGPVQCHGLAGNIEFLLDMYQVTCDPVHLGEAYTLGRMLEAFGSEQDGLLMWPSESPRVFTPDYMVGYAGVAMCLLRLSDPQRLPHQLSRRGFRHARNASETVIQRSF